MKKMSSTLRFLVAAFVGQTAGLPVWLNRRRAVCATMAALAAGGFCAAARAQFNSGSDGSDGAFNPVATNTVINMADHPTGIYNYSSVNIPSGVTVSFIPNANNSPVVWLVQSNAVISGTVNLNGQLTTNGIGGVGGPGGYRGGNGGTSPTAGLGPGGGAAYRE